MESNIADTGAAGCRSNEKMGQKTKPQDDTEATKEGEKQTIIETYQVPMGTPVIKEDKDVVDDSSDNDDDDHSSVYSKVMRSNSGDNNSVAVSELGSSFNTSANDSAMGIANIQGIETKFGNPKVPTYPEGEYEDDKAQMIAKLMKNHGTLVTSNLVERSSLIQSVTWLSHHVPGCVLKSLFESIMRARKRRARMDHKQQRRRNSQTRGGSAPPASSQIEQENSAIQQQIEDYSSVGMYNSTTGGDKNRWLSMDCSLSTGFSSSEGYTPITNGTERTSASPNPPFIRGHTLPYSKNYDSAILFCDISGFTKIAAALDVESLSNAINDYFQMIVSEITSHGGDVLKFAGDALFAEWKVNQHEPDYTLHDCVASAANCAAAIVENCSDYAVMSKPIGFTKTASRRTSLIKRDSGLESSTGSRRGSDLVSGDSNHELHDSFRRRGSVITESVGESEVEEARRSSMSSISEVDERRRSSMSSIDESEHSVGAPHSRKDIEHQTNNQTNSFNKFFVQRRLSASEIRRRRSTNSSEVATLNVKCAVGVGHIVGIHVGDDISRREYLILGDPIHQVARAESLARHGQVFASPETMKYLSKIDNPGDDPVIGAALIAWEQAEQEGKPVRIFDNNQRFFEVKARRRATRCDSHGNTTSITDSLSHDSLVQSCDELNNAELEWLKRMISLYVHPVVVNDDHERATTGMTRRTDQERHLAEAELRNVYTCFISPLIDYKLSGNDESDQILFGLLNDIMNLCTRELDKVQGHLRQFILDDKGLVLICTFGLRGSTFPNMIAQRALPFSLSIHKLFEEELGIKSTVGGTFGKAYCGVVGGLGRHEFAVLGPSVNLAARLMASEGNPGILVDKNVRLLTSQVFFKPLPAVKAKGYDEPVPIFEPKKHVENEWGLAKKNFVGRETEIKHVLNIAKDVINDGTASRLLFVSATTGSGKSTLMVQGTALARAMAMKLRKRVIITRNISNDGDSRIPFSLFRSIFRDVLSQVQIEGEDVVENLSTSMKRRMSSGSGAAHALPRISSETSLRKSLLAASLGDKMPCHATRDDSTDTFSVEAQWDELTLNTQSSKSSTMSTDATRFRYICQELNAPPEFMDFIGKRLLGFRDRSGSTSTTAKAPNIQNIVEFMADAFVRCTKHANLVLLALDDVQWMDEMSWMVVQAIFERGLNVLIFCGSRPPSSNPLSVNPNFWSDLHGQYRDEGRFSEVALAPFSEPEVKNMIATTFDFDVTEISESFIRNVYATSSGMPYYLRYVLDAIKQNDLTVRLENGLIGMKSAGSDSKVESSFGSVNELLLCRLDALDSSVRTVLYLAAVIGMEFTLLDAALAYEEMIGIGNEGYDEVDPLRLAEANTLIRVSFDVAIREGIIEQSLILQEEEDDDDDDEEFFNEDDDRLCSSMGNMIISLKGRRKAHPFFAENCRLRFTHDSWMRSILNVILDERKQEMHEHVALSLERELDDEVHNKDDFEKQIRVFKHWKASRNFAKASALALKIGGQLMLLGMNSQAILLFDDVLEILKQMSDDQLKAVEMASVEEKLDTPQAYGEISSLVLDAIDAPELENLIKVNIAKGKSFCTLTQQHDGAKAYQNSLEILNNTPSANDKRFDRSVSFPIFSGLFIVLKMGAIEQDAECSYEKDLCKQFAEQARLNGDPVHYGRAVAMQAETLGRLGKFEDALEVIDTVKSIYNIETQHADICKAYGSDRVAQAYSHSVNYNMALGRTDAALEACDYIIEEIAPKSNPANIHNMFCLLYSVIVALKENGLAIKARDVFQLRILDAFEEHFGPEGSTYSKPLFKPVRAWLHLGQAVKVMLTLEIEGDSITDEEIDEYVTWALDSEKFEVVLGKPQYEAAWANICIGPTAVASEICFSLAKLRNSDEELRNRLLLKAIRLMGKSAESTAGKIPFAHMYAKEKERMMINFGQS